MDPFTQVANDAQRSREVLEQKIADLTARCAALEQELDRFKRQLSVQEARTGEWHQACDAAEVQSAALRHGLEQLVAKLDLVLPHVDGLFALNFIRSGTQYTGPNLVAELDQARALLAAQPEQTTTDTKSTKKATCPACESTDVVTGREGGGLIAWYLCRNCEHSWEPPVVPSPSEPEPPR